MRPGMLSSNATGILCVIGASIAFTTNDMGVKWLSGDYPLHQIVLARASFALLITLILIVPLEGGYAGLRTRRPFLHLIRGLAVVTANMTFFVSLATLPLGEATAIFFMAPLFITAFSVVFLGEIVGVRRWVAVLAGLAGVIIVVRPGTAAFQITALLPLIAAAAYALLQIMTRKLGMAERASTMAFYIQLTFIFASTCVGLALGDGRYADSGNPSLDFIARQWIWPPIGDIAIMVGLGTLSAAGGYLISQAYRLCEAGLVAPFEYISMPLAIFWSIFIWGDWPAPVAWIGIALIAGAGLYVFYRETVLSRSVAVARPMPRNR